MMIRQSQTAAFVKIQIKKFLFVFLIVDGFSLYASHSLPYDTEWNREVEKAEELVKQGDNREALKALAEAQKKYQEKNDEEGVLLCMDRSIRILYELGEYSGALDMLKEAYPIGVRLHGDAAELDANYGDVYLFSGDSQKAYSHYQKALQSVKDYVFKTSYSWFPSRKELATQIRKSRVVIHANVELGLKFLFEKDLERSLAHLQKADEMSNRSLEAVNRWGLDKQNDGGLFEGIGYCKTFLGTIYGRKREHSKANEFFDQGEQAFEKGKCHYGLVVNKAFRYEIQILSSQTKWDKEKLEEMEKFLVQAQAVGAIPVVWRMSYQLGGILAKQKRFEESKRYLMRAVEILESTRARFRDDNMKQVFISSVQDVYHALIRLLHEMKKDEEAFDYFERAKSRSFLEMLANRPVASPDNLNPELISQEKRLQREMDDILIFLKGNDPKRSELLQRYENLSKQKMELFNSLKSQNSNSASLLTITTVPSKKILERLGDKGALVAYFVDETNTLIFVLQKGQVSVAESNAGRQTLLKLVQQYREAIASTQHEMTADLGKELAGFLWEPIQVKLGGVQQLILVPSEALHYLPFASLPTSPTHYLAQDYTLSILPNGSSLFFIERNVTQNMGRSLALGNPKRPKAEFELKFAEQEVKELSTLFTKPTVWTGIEAKESSLKAAKLNDIAVLHLAVHGHYDEKEVLDSALLLAPDHREDGDLHAWEIFSLKMNPKVVVLSACQSGLSQVSSGNEIQGLNRAFLYAGAGSVLASLWNVSDESTYKLMKCFYQQLGSANPAKALHQAQLSLMQEQPEPYFWASFYLTGSALE